MFTQALPVEVFDLQKEFIRIMDPVMDFRWWARTLITEETKELDKADTENEGMEQIFKELADVIYVVAGFYNTMPLNCQMICSDETNEELNAIYEEACNVASRVSMKYRIPVELMTLAFKEVHRSNMSKLGDDGLPIRREDGKILKGPNYSPADMKPIVAMWEQFTANVDKEEANATSD